MCAISSQLTVTTALCNRDEIVDILTSDLKKLSSLIDH